MGLECGVCVVSGWDVHLAEGLMGVVGDGKRRALKARHSG